MNLSLPVSFLKLNPLIYGLFSRFLKYLTPYSIWHYNVNKFKLIHTSYLENMDIKKEAAHRA